MQKTEVLESWISLWRVPGIGSVTFKKLLDKFETPGNVFAATASSLKQAGFSEKLVSNIKDNPSSNSTKNDIDWLNTAQNHHLITIHCSEYPILLKQISNPPPLLYVHGKLALLNDPQVAIIGSRNPTQGGLSNTYEFSKFLGGSGLCITSGLALGIDGAAHQGALDANSPTIAVIATGIDRVYPARHRELAHKIVEDGAIITEFPLGTQPKSENFPRRNRIISGISHGTLVIEAAKKSGSLITARLASEQNREVFAIPGSIHNPLSKGCHQLIREGAKLVETAQDILEEMANVIDINAVFDNSKQNNTELETIESSPLEEDSEHHDLLEKMAYDPVSIDELVIRTGQSPESIAAMLLILELQNKVSSNGGGTYTRIR